MFTDNVDYIELKDMDDHIEQDLLEQDPIGEEVENTEAQDSKLAHEIADGLVPTTDDPKLPSFTFRVLVIGSLWNVFLAVSNGIFSFRTSDFGIPGIVATLLSYPMGIFLSRVLPRRKINIFGWYWELNDGDFSVKEHVLIYVIAAGK
jgi:hypothetical protein